MQESNAVQLRETHSKRIEDILNLLNDIAAWYQEDEDNNTQVKSRAFMELAENVRTGEYSIVMVGEFSTGKSTLLNALMGERLLPSFKTETTATVNFLRYTERAEQTEKGRVFYTDGSVQTLESADFDVVQQYVSTRGQDVANKVAHLDLYLDSAFLRDNVTLVDSPGLNGVAEGHKDITQEQILKSHACIFVFSSDHPGSKSDFEFLSDLKSNVSTILFVLNKIDEIKDDEGETPEGVVRSIQENFKKVFPNDSCPEIWPLAALPALAARSSFKTEYRGAIEFSEVQKGELLKSSRILEFESRLMEFLTKGEKTKRQSLEPVIRVAEVGGRSKADLEREIRLLTQSDDTGEIEELIAAIQDAIRKCETEMQNVYADVSRKIKAGLRDVTEAIDADISRYTERAIAEIDSFSSLEEINEYISGMEEKYNSYTKTLMGGYDEKLRESIIDQVFENYSTFAKHIQESIDGIQGGLMVFIKINAKEAVFDAGLAEMERQEENVKRQLEQLREQEAKGSQDALKAKLNLRQQQKIEQQLRLIEDQKAEINGRIMPAIIQTTKQEMRDKTFSEKGVLGVVGGFLFGANKVPVQVLVIEDAAYKAEIAKRDSELQTLSAEKEKNAAILDNHAENAAILAEDDLARAQAVMNMKEQEYLKLLQENREKLHNKFGAQIQKARNEQRNLLNDKTTELIGEIRKVLRNQEKTYAGVVNSVITANLKQALEEEQRKQNVLRARLNTSKKERDARIAKLNNRLEKLNAILDNAISLQTKLESLHVENV